MFGILQLRIERSLIKKNQALVIDQPRARRALVNQREVFTREAIEFLKSQALVALQLRSAATLGDDVKGGDLRVCKAPIEELADREERVAERLKIRVRKVSARALVAREVRAS